MRNKNNIWTKWLCWYICLVVWICQNAAFDFIENTFIASLVVGLITLLGVLLYSKTIDYIIDKELSDYDLTTIKILIDIFTTLIEKKQRITRNQRRK